MLSTAPSGHRSSFLWNPMVSLHTQKKRSVSSLGSCVCVLPSVFPFFLFFCRRLSPISYRRPLSVFPLRQLMENKITAIERGAFQDLKELERL